MTAKDQLKIMRSGFTIVRKRDFEVPVEHGPFKIMEKKISWPEWHVLSRHATRSERDRELTRLLSEPNVVED